MAGNEAKNAYHHGNLDAALLDAVGDIIKAGGVGSVSLREAARRAGVSHSAPAHHFGDKLGMLTAFCARGLRLFRDRMQAAAASTDDPEERLVALGIEYLRFAMEERAYFEVMFRSEMHDEDDEDLKALSQATFGTLMEVATEVDEVQQLGHETPMLTAISAWATVHGLATLWQDGALDEFWPGDNIYELAAKLFDVKSQWLHRGS